MPVETRWFRGDYHTVNGLTCRKLLTTLIELIWEYHSTCYVYVAAGIRVWKRSSAGVESEITAGTPVAVAYCYAPGGGAFMGSWNCPLTSMTLTDSVVVRIYWNQDGGGWVLVDTWQTEQLGAIQLSAATWSLTYILTADGPPDYGSGIYGGSAVYPARIEGFTWISGWEKKIYIGYVYLVK